ncbi:hypothetical protein GCM10011578_060270 [Streptomyces fuscichromogenes]|uniref:Uncharacterized protein n=1 Tax=Streptomyces fuscichromogenes TaxID=1324013 RepID=A0A918CTY3_9ACTN|nr:hypothetical protein GCM10011578_060270 [Streptomyces fuscichromogenes]
MLMDKPRRGFWCECWTENLSDGTGWPALRASFDAYSAPQADRWVAIALRTISPALDPDASDEVWAWLHDGRAETRRALLRSEPCTVSVTQASTRIRWPTAKTPNSQVAHTPSSPTQGPRHQASLIRVLACRRRTGRDAGPGNSGNLPTCTASWRKSDSDQACGFTAALCST